jgi:hypothetical protein
MGCRKNPNDGTFLMCEEDLVKYFVYFNICRYRLGYMNSCFDIANVNGTFFAVDFEIESQGIYFFTTYLQDKIMMDMNHPERRRWSWMFLFKE